ncbi:hypothetical protein [Lactobacillus sp. PV034]|uniref:hypothetical protein n=1 Tax=Lactobacillus sp. PV034 TaxID=2594495 RepID=UPI0022402D59|nr:hypothetical protein [Lactobacillus sp. PV034]QNQ80783.1 hypothetical protein FP432_04055 [Lactobacillus sp. PV034]
MPKAKKPDIKLDTPKYSKENLVNSSVFTITERDILKIVLDNSKTYTLDEAKKAIKNFKGGI